MKRRLVLFSVVMMCMGIPAVLFAWPIPDTGQTTCYDEAGVVIDCAGTGQDGEYLINPPSYTKLDADGNELEDTAAEWAMVRDNVTGLIWEVKQNKDDIVDYSNPQDADNTYTWYDSNPDTNGGSSGTPGNGTDTEDFIAALINSSFGGYTDWSLPTEEELRSIAIYERYDPAIDINFFPNIVLFHYWSSSPMLINIDNVWGINFESGYNYWPHKNSHLHVRAVRGRRFEFLKNFVINSGATVTDKNTGLMWRLPTEGPMAWQEALSYSMNLTTDGYTDWRLPSLKELVSISDLSTSDPSTYQPFFSDTVSSYYWSSSTVALEPSRAWSLHFYYGADDYILKSDDEYVRAVRGGQVLLSDHLFITNPAQASHWTIGCPMHIRWDTKDISPDVNILLSRDGGRNYTEVLAESTPNDGEFQWVVTGPATVNAYLKIEPLSDPGKFTAQGLFSIEASSLSPPAFTQPDPPLTNATSFVYNITFPKSVSGVDATDFTLLTSEDVTGQIGAVSGGGANYTVPIIGILGDGEIRLDYIADCSVKTSQGVPITIDQNGFRTTIDQTYPRPLAIDRAGPLQVSGEEVDFIVRFSEPVIGVNKKDFLITTNGGTLEDGTISNISMDGAQYTVTVTGYAGVGILGLILLDHDTITDPAGNPLGGAGDSNGNLMNGQSYEITLDPDIQISRSSLTVAEPDGSAAFTVSLARRPTAPVSITVYSANRFECYLSHMNDTEIHEDPTTVVLDESNWETGVSLTVTAKRDYRVDGDYTTRIITLPASSADLSFDRIDPPDPTVTIQDFHEGMALTQVYPTVGEVDKQMTIFIDGVGFTPGMTVYLYQDTKFIPITDTYINETGTRIELSVPPVEREGAYNITICSPSGCIVRVQAVTFYDPAAAKKMKRKKAILVAGTGPTAGNDLWAATRRCTERAYEALIEQGFSHENILYLSAGPREGNVDLTATPDSLKQAILMWAKGLAIPGRSDIPPGLPADELVVYMTGHGDQGIFRINDMISPSQQVGAGELAEWFNGLQYGTSAMTGNLIFIYDACLAGSFLQPLANPGEKPRYVVASVPDDKPAWFTDEGEFSFSWYFWDKVWSTGRLYRSFTEARNLMGLNQNQNPVMDNTGDGNPDNIDLNDIEEEVFIGRGRLAASDTPQVVQEVETVTLQCQGSLDVSVKREGEMEFEEAWATLIEDSATVTEAQDPIILENRITLLDPNGDKEYDGRVSGLTRNGHYTVNFYAKDSAVTSGTRIGQTQITRECDASVSDVIFVLKTLAGNPMPAPDAAAFDRMDCDRNDRLDLGDAVNLLRLIGEL